MKVVWTEQAFRRLTEIEDYIGRDDPAAAERYIDRLVSRTEVLEVHPELGRTLPELPGSELRELTESNYRIVYRIRNDQIEVITVFEGHQRLRSGDLPAE